MKKQIGKRDLEKERYWRSVAQEWKASELPVAAFCRQSGIKVTTFYSWLSVIRGRDREASTSQSLSRANKTFVPKFVPVQLKDEPKDKESLTAKEKPSGQVGHVEIWLRNGTVVRAGAMSTDVMWDLLKRLGGITC